ncbi:hypothetical protein D5086_013046 [Populus alba]|uniref:Uncharacterized protein n=2 Tax=Populus alba TaxID=43335 RepID=A0A4U5QSP3_POPAL|nr:hypothetical protein D5086_0000053140 [Populus alba]
MDFSKLAMWPQNCSQSASHQVQHCTCNYVAAMLILRQPFPVVKERHDQLENVNPNWLNPLPWSDPLDPFSNADWTSDHQYLPYNEPNGIEQNSVTDLKPFDSLV